MGGLTEHKRAHYACLYRAIAQILNGDFFLLLFYIIIHKMKQQITENEENLFLGKKMPRCQFRDLKVVSSKACCIRNLALIGPLISVRNVFAI